MESTSDLMERTKDLPPRYSRQNSMDLVTDQDLSNMPGGLKYLMNKKFVVKTEGETEQKVRWDRRPRKRFMQLYSIRFLKSLTENIKLNQICGTIELDNHVLFKRQIRRGRHDIDSLGFVRLTGPDFPLWAIDYNMIFTKVYRGKQPDDFFHPVGGVTYENHEGLLLIDEEEVPFHAEGGVYGKYLSVPEMFEKRSCDKLITEKIETQCGTIEVAYAIFTDAADSYLTMKLLNWRGGGIGPNIYGAIIASDTLCMDDSRAWSSAFDRNRYEKVPIVQVGSNIPLRRPMNVVPMGHSLVVDICLFHKDKDSSCFDHPICQTREHFEAMCGADERGLFECKKLSWNVCGNMCEFEVTAHWLPYWSLGMRNWPNCESSDEPQR